MRTRMIWAAAMAAVTATLTAGCGGGSGVATSVGGGASVLPSNTIAFAAIDTDTSSAQWQALSSLLGKFGAGPAQLEQAFHQKTKLDWAKDVQPALGPELDLAVLPGAKPQLVGLTQPKDASKLDALLSHAGLVSRKVGDWTAFAKDASAFAKLNTTPSLAQDNTYVEATAKLAGDALATAYANGAEAKQLLGSLPGRSQQTALPRRRVRFGPRPGQLVAAEAFAWGAAEVLAKDNGLELQAFAQRVEPSAATLGAARVVETPTPPYRAVLVDEIPAGALAVADFQVPPGAFESADTTKLPKPVQSLLARHPTLPIELDAVLGGESALYVSPGALLPAVTLVTQPADTAAAVQALPDVESALRDALAGALGAAKGKTKATGVAGLFDPSTLPIYHAVNGGQLVVSTSQQAIADFHSGAGERLSADGTFQEAQQASAMPAKTSGFLYVNVKDALPLVQTLAPMAGITLPSGLDPLRTLTAYAADEGDTSSYTVFLEVK